MFNPQQLQAIKALGQNVIVSASAGAGKTTVLIARLMKRILKDGVRIDEICAMTFTEAAASEMKTRLLAELNKENQSNASDFLSEQIALVETASISTIHSFCLNIIKNYGYVIGLNPERTANILSPAEASLLNKEAMTQTLDNLIINNPVVAQTLLDTFSANPLNKSALEDAVFNLGQWILEKKDKDRAIEEALDLYRANSLESWPMEMRSLYYDFHKEKLEEIKECLMDLSDKLGSEEAFIEHQDNLMHHIGEIHATIQIIESRNPSFNESIPTVLDIKTPASTKNETYTKLRKDFEKLISNYLDTYDSLDHQFELLNKQVPLVSDLIQLSLNYLETLNQMKVERNVLDFSDFEPLALEIITKNDGAVASLIRQQYKEVMVDEFQDTNEYQDEIIRAVSNGTNIFRVGDIKQSIYGFRGAKPQIMQDLLKSQEGKNLFLSFNYRSKNSIVQYNNAVFDKLMNLTRSNTYDKNDYVNVGIPKQSIDSEPVELHIIERFDDKNIPSQARQTAQHIAQEIIRRHEKGMEFKDMVVLVRSHGSKDFLKEAFEEANIPHFLNELSGFYNSEIITQTIHLLNYALTRNDYYLAFVLTSLYFNMSDDDLARLSLHNRNIKTSLEELEPSVNDKLENLIQYWANMNIVSIISDIIAFDDVYQTRLSIQDKTNLDFLLEKAVLYQATSTPTLYGFTQFIHEFKDEKSSEASPLSSDADVVSAMTIHQSKGLQFPLVFLFGMGGHTVMSHRDTLVLDDDLGIALNHVDLEYRETKKNIIRSIIEFKQDHDEIEEVLRLLYVALTRAQDRMIIVDSIKEIVKYPLNRRLLRNHTRKVDLLLASSPSDTVVKAINSFEIGDSVHEGNEIIQTRTFDLINDSIPSMKPQMIPNQALDLSRSMAMDYGTTIHEAIENLPQRMWTDEDLILYQDSIRKKLLSYRQHQFTCEIYDNYELNHEMAYLLRDSNGIMDLVATSPNKVILIDFKSDTVDEETIRARYTEQIERYKKALSTMYPEHDIEAYIYSFSLESYLKF